MSWRVYAERIETADMVGTPRVFQKFTLEKTQILKAFRTWVVFFNNPSFTALTLKIYSNLGGSPAQLLFTSDKSWSPSEICSTNFGAKEIYFDFENSILLRKDSYHAVLSATDYVGNSSSHLGWMRGFPDPNVLNISADSVNIARIPFYLAAIDDLRQ